MSKQQKKNNAKGNEWLKKSLKDYRSAVFLLTLCNVVAVLFSLAFAYLARYVINSATEKDKKGLIVFSAVVLSVLLFKIFLQTAINYQSEKYRAKLTVGLRQKLFSQALSADYSAVRKYHSGDLLNRFTTDVSEVASDTVYILPAVAGMLIQSIGAICALLTLDPLFTLVFIAGGIALGCLVALLKKKLKRFHKEAVEADGKSRAFMQESISASLTLRAYDARKSAEEKSEKTLEEYYEKRMKRNRLRAFANGAFSLLSSAGMIFSVVWCGIGILKGTTDYGSALSVILLLGQLQHPLTSFSSVVSVYYARSASAERLAEIAELPQEKNATDGKTCPYEEIRSFKAENLTFGYGEEKLFDGACAEFKRGKISCVTGDSGAGKSTLFKLLLSVYTPDGGSICKTGKDESEYPLNARDRNLFAYVPQGNFLFSGTIRENLVFFAKEKSSDISEEKLEKALETACAEFVRELPKGSDTLLREHGEGLSEGQLQRLAVARALLSERPVLLLDEATSALDEETEARLLENLKGLQRKTCIIVTHRPAAMKIADEIFRIQNGKIERSERKENE